MSARVLGIDLSLTCTGIAGDSWTDTIKPSPRLRGPDRLIWIRDHLADRWLAGVDLVAVEGPSYGSQSGQRGHHERAGLWWLVRVTLRTRGIPVAVVAPSSLKRYATGKGTASKADVIREVTKRHRWFAGGEDEADALVLACMAADHLGAAAVRMPASQRMALDAVEWPELPATVDRPTLLAQVGCPDHGGRECRHELHGADGGRCPGCGWDSHPIPTEPAPVPVPELGLPAMPVLSNAIDDVPVDLGGVVR